MRRMTALVSVGLLVLAVGACQRNKREDAEKSAEQTAGDVERAGEEAGNKLDRGLQRADEKAGEMARGAGDAARDAARDVKESARDAAHGAAEVGKDVGDAAKRGAQDVGEAGERAGEAARRETHEAGEEAERALQPRPTETTTGEVGAETGMAGMGGQERMAQAISETEAQLSTCDLSKPVYFFFKPATSNVAAGELTRVHKLGACLKDKPGTTTITVVAYGDTEADKSKNAEMGLKRANNIAQVLLHRGMQPEQVILQSLGESIPQRDAAGRDNGDWARRISVRVGK